MATWLASAVIGVGLTAWPDRAAAGARLLWRPHPACASSRQASRCFILLPVLRVIVDVDRLRTERDYRFIAITAIVLIIILMGFALGMYLPAASLS